ncbi:hypothetical protein LSTR_LSTR009917 [Laodelphax striatellus]|uniref:Peptidase S1 domain-containing protein n=1 Tax=Laodelphax striatellus TaxID=195883 RepID=A0A482WK84_LAOST|nr:hypothetical protein LSTR_LSTR009917 [Laodelphax striatellus]
MKVSHNVEREQGTEEQKELDGSGLDMKPPGRQCIVPDDDHSSYSRLGCKLEDCLLKKGEAVNDNEHFLLNCQRPYVRPDDVLVVRCSNGEWQPPKHTCQKNCKPLVSTSLIIECELNGQKVNCNEEVPPATDAGYKCRDGYETKESFLQQSTNRCLPNGKWLYKPLPHCYYRCGILNKPEEQKLNPLIHDGVDTIATNHPWNVGLYYFDRRNNTYNMFCGGTLISPFTVLSAAHCFINDDTAERLNANDVWITLGKTERNWSTIEDGVQRIQLENYHIPDKYAGRNISFLNDVAVLTLRTQASISRTHGPMPACLAKSKNKLDRGSIGLLSGWGEIHGEYPETLQAANLTFQPYAYCREHANSTISADHFCTYNNEVNGSISQPTVSAGDSGSGFMYKINNNHFVYGVTSTRTSTNYGFTLKHGIATLKRGDCSEKFCRIPSIEGISFRCRENQDTANCILNPGLLVKETDVIYFRCEKGFLANENTQTIFCYKAKWISESSLTSLCLRACPPLDSSNTDFRCIHKGRTVDCGASVAGTVATATCKEGHSGRGNPSQQITCLPNAQWEKLNYSCEKICGILDPIAANDQANLVVRNPWNVGIYVKSGGKYVQFCSGTLISPTKVLTAANCIINPKNGQLRQKKRLRIALGNYHSSFQHPHDQAIQIREIAEFKKPDNYQGSSNHYYNDLAIIELAAAVDVNNHVMPICIDKKRLYKLSPDRQGSIVGWHLHTSASGDITAQSRCTMNDEDQRLKSGQLSYVPRDECSNYLTSFLSPDKFCAFSPTGTDVTSVCNYDSGAGLTFKINDVHYIYGIVTTLVNTSHIRHTNNFINTFTDLTDNENSKFVIDNL